MGRRGLIQCLLPAILGLFVAWWLSFSQEPRFTLTIPRYRQDDFVSLEISPNGRFLLARNHVTWYVGSTTPDEYLQCWNLDRGGLCWSLTMKEEDFWRLGAFAPDDQRIAVPTKNTVRLWNLATGTIDAEHPAKGMHSQWSKSLAFTKAGILVGLLQDDPEEGAIAYEIESGRVLHRLPKGHVTPLVADVLLHSFEGHLRPFQLDTGVDLSKPYLQNRFERVERDAKGELVSSFGMGHDFQGCTHHHTVLFGTFRLGGMTSSTFYFYHDYQTGAFDEIDAGWGTLNRTFLRPSWTRKYLLKTDFNSPRDWLSQWFPGNSGKNLTLRDYDSKRLFFSIPNGETGVFSLDDRVLATYVGQGRIQIWDLPPRTPWLKTIGGGAGSCAGAFLLLHWAMRRKKQQEHKHGTKMGPSSI